MIAMLVITRGYHPWSKHLLQHEAQLSNEAGEGEGAEGVDAVHVLQDALLLLLGRVDKGCIMLQTDICSSCKCTFPSAT